MIDDRFGALVPGFDVDVAGAEQGPLAGLRFVAKDVFDVAGFPTGAGNPTRRATTGPAARSAGAVTQLLAAGAHLVGKARTDELAYSLSGLNELDGTPENPAAPGHLTGGSSSGSAAAVAGGLADIGLGTDTGGSIRVPASHCGLVGLRPTHGRVRADGLVPLAPSFDTPGWLARSGSIATAVGEVLLSSFTAGAHAPSSLIVLDDVVARASSSVLAAGIDALAARLGAPLEHALLGSGDDLDRWRDAYRVLQGAEAWAVHGPWIRADDPPMGAAVRARFDAASRLSTDEIAAAMREREQVTARLGGLVSDGTALVVPAAGGPPLRADSDPATIDAFRHATMTITVLAPLAGLPAVAMPIETDGLPMGLSLIGAAGTDESLLASLVT